MFKQKSLIRIVLVFLFSAIFLSVLGISQSTVSAGAYSPCGKSRRSVPGKYDPAFANLTLHEVDRQAVNALDGTILGTSRDLVRGTVTNLSQTDDGKAPCPTATQPSAPVINNAPLCTIAIPSNAVLGVVTVQTQVYYGPSTSQPVPGLTVGGGGQLSKWYVLGQDATHRFWKIVIGCNYVWVRVGTMAPSPDAPNANAPLPTNVVT